MYNGNVQQNPLLVEPCVTKEFSISPRFSPMIFYPHANSMLYGQTFVHQYSYYNNRLYAQNPVFEIVHDESVKAYLHICTS